MSIVCCDWVRPCCDTASEIVVPAEPTEVSDTEKGSYQPVLEESTLADLSKSKVTLTVRRQDSDHDYEERWAVCEFAHESLQVQAEDREKDVDSDCGNTSESTECPVDGQGLEEVNGSSAVNLPISSAAQAVPVAQGDWWSAADPAKVHGCEILARPGQLRNAKVVKTADYASADAAASLYESMGVQDPSFSYLAVWLKLNGSSLVFISSMSPELASSIAGQKDLVGSRLKLLLNPVQVQLPMPTKGPEDADTVGSFFGSNAASTSITQTKSGAAIACIHIDLYAKWIMRLALQQVGFRLGNTLELLLVDWPGQAVLASIRLQVTNDFLALVA
eukprot:TRINITY_DN5172_c0_g1_i2.p1 TRINITY_DN5172_c0_g1~~TRINITY_DN5172_c0_g1_i2.p1  ORF type:complete len:333 (-),score=79.35 TRINITY_DN5172_c0_g1_i2:672-1670(-)